MVFLPILFLPETEYPYIEDRMLDVPEVYTIYRSGSLASLLPDSCTKIATHELKETDAISEMLARVITKTGMRVLKLDKSEVGRGMEYVVDEFIGDAFMNLDSKPVLSDNMFIMISVDQGDFGHFIGCHHKAGVFYLFDSMMTFDGDNAESGYTIKIKKTLRDVFSIKGRYPFVVDYTFDRKSSDPLRFYSFEVTGGALTVENKYLSTLSQSHQFMADSVIMGVDNQNQYCWMWMVVYLLSRFIDEEAYSWGMIQKKIWEADIIPVVFIKCFISMIAPLSWSRDNYFVKNFNTILSNAETYRATFDTSNSRFCLYECAFGRSFLELPTPMDLVSAFKTIVDRIDQIKIKRIRYQQNQQHLTQRADQLLSSQLKRFINNRTLIIPSTYNERFERFKKLLEGEFSPERMMTV